VFYQYVELGIKIFVVEVRDIVYYKWTMLRDRNALNCPIAKCAESWNSFQFTNHTRKINDNDNMNNINRSNKSKCKFRNMLSFIISITRSHNGV
jgi:hypothetical protein